MRCALFVLAALLEVQALRTEPLEFDSQKDQASIKEADMLVPQALGSEMQDWSRLPAGDEALRRIFSMDATEIEDDRDDYEYPYEQLKSIDQLDDAQLQRMANYLLKVLQRPNVYEAPVLFIKDPMNELNDKPYPLELADLKSVDKRTRYYRRYPWKRQNSRKYQALDYDPYNTCTLTRKDVFKLLVALHDARQGKKSRIVNFCNRQRPASAVYTNIRFLGRRRK